MSQRVPEYTARYKYITDLATTVELSGSYQEIFSFNATCTLEQVQLKFNSNRVKVRIKLDGFTALEVDCKKLLNFIGNKEHPQVLFWDNADKILYFTPNNPIQVKTAITIEALSTNASWWGSNQDYKGIIATIQDWP